MLTKKNHHNEWVKKIIASLMLPLLRRSRVSFLSKNCPRQQGLGQFLADPRRNSNGWWVSQSLDQQRKCWAFHKNNKYSSPLMG